MRKARRGTEDGLREDEADCGEQRREGFVGGGEGVVLEVRGEARRCGAAAVEEDYCVGMSGGGGGVEERCLEGGWGLHFCVVCVCVCVYVC